MLTSDRVEITIAFSTVAGVLPGRYIMPGQLAGLFFRQGGAELTEFIETKMPTSPQTKSSDLGEVLRTTFVHECIPFKQGIKRLRWKDQRKISMCDDVPSFNLNQATRHLTVLKAE